MDQLKEAVAFSAINPHDKHVDVLLRSSALCREMGGVTIILCKSGECLVCCISVWYMSSCILGNVLAIVYCGGCDY